MARVLSGMDLIILFLSLYLITPSAGVCYRSMVFLGMKPHCVPHQCEWEVTLSSGSDELSEGESQGNQ